jgi:hypothetical protein
VVTSATSPAADPTRRVLGDWTIATSDPSLPAGSTMNFFDRDSVAIHIGCQTIGTRYELQPDGTFTRPRRGHDSPTVNCPRQIDAGTARLLSELAAIAVDGDNATGFNSDGLRILNLSRGDPQASVALADALRGPHGKQIGLELGLKPITAPVIRGCKHFVEYGHEGGFCLDDLDATPAEVQAAIDKYAADPVMVTVPSLIGNRRPRPFASWPTSGDHQSQHRHLRRRLQLPDEPLSLHPRPGNRPTAVRGTPGSGRHRHPRHLRVSEPTEGCTPEASRTHDHR